MLADFTLLNMVKEFMKLVDISDYTIYVKDWVWNNTTLKKSVLLLIR